LIACTQRSQLAVIFIQVVRQACFLFSVLFFILVLL